MTQFQAAVIAAVKRLGFREVSRLCDVSFQTVDHWVTGKFTPHQLGIPSILSALAAGAQSAETNEDLAQSEGRQSGPKGNAQKGSA